LSNSKEKSSQLAWKLAPLRHFFPLKVVPLIEVLLYLVQEIRNVLVVNKVRFSGSEKSSQEAPNVLIPRSSGADAVARALLLLNYRVKSSKEANRRSLCTQKKEKIYLNL
jgi:hypothetical protein